MHGSNNQHAQPTPTRRFSLARLAKQPLVIRTPQGTVVIGAEHRDGKRRVTVRVDSQLVADPLDICDAERLRSS